MIFDWFRRPKLTVEVLGADIVVTLPGTSCRVVYSKTADNKLVASTFSAPKVSEGELASRSSCLARGFPA